MKLEEEDYNRQLRHLWPYWSERVEPSNGMRTGIPDVWIFGNLEERHFDRRTLFVPNALPIELKMAEPLSRSWVKPSKIRPAQFNWHCDYPFTSLFMFCVDKKDFIVHLCTFTEQKFKHWKKEGIRTDYGPMRIEAAVKLLKEMI